MKKPSLTCGALVFCAAALALRAQSPPEPPAAGAKGKPIAEVAHFDEYQVTGIAVSKDARLFANFPRWSNDYKYAVVEVMPDSSTKPFPDETWNSWKDKDPDVGSKFLCVQSVTIDDTGALWALDSGSPGMQGVLPGGAKLVKMDIDTDKIRQVIPFGADVCPAKSYLNDVRVDTGRQIAYISESGVGAIIVVDLKTGKARRTLDQDSSVMAEKNVTLTIDGKEVLTAEKKKPQFNCDGIALSPDNEYVYYQALMGATLYRVPAAVLRDPNSTASQQSKAVEKIATIFPCDGYWMDKQGNLYLSDLRDDAIQRRTPDGKIELVCSDPRIQWPDSFAEGPGGALFFSCSQIHRSPRFNGGQSARTTPYAIFKVIP